MTALIYIFIGLIIGYAWVGLSVSVILWRHGFFNALVFAMLWPIELLLCVMRRVEKEESGYENW